MTLPVAVCAFNLNDGIDFALSLNADFLYRRGITSFSCSRYQAGSTANAHSIERHTVNQLLSAFTDVSRQFTCANNELVV